MTVNNDHRRCRIANCTQPPLQADSLCRLHYLKQSYVELQEERKRDERLQREFNWEMGFTNEDE